MGLSFLTPTAALLALASVLPLAAFALFERRARRVRRALGLPEPPRRGRAATAAALTAVPGLLGLAASQPVVDHVRTRYARTDTEAFFVFDTSRSMLARTGLTGESRLGRAKDFARELRARLPDVPVGLASMSDRTLPHLFPTVDLSVFDSTLQEAIAVEQPPPVTGLRTRVTTLGALSAIATQNFFAPAARHRLVVAFSDFESRPFVDASLGSLFRRPPAIQTVFVRFWRSSERVYTQGLVEPEYRPDASSAGVEDRLARAVGGSAFTETELGDVTKRVRELLGNGKATAEGSEHGKFALAPYLALGAVLPLSFLLWRRNL
jgi:hypothetical protein